MRHNPDDHHARDLVRSLRYLERLDGVIVHHDDRLWILSRPAARPADPIGLAKALLAPEMPTPHRLGAMLGVEEVREVSVHTLARASYHLTRVSWPVIDTLARSGSRALRRFRGADLDELRAEFEARVDRLTRLWETPPDDADHSPWRHLGLAGWRGGSNVLTDPAWAQTLQLLCGEPFAAHAISELEELAAVAELEEREGVFEALLHPALTLMLICPASTCQPPRGSDPTRLHQLAVLAVDLVATLAERQPAERVIQLLDCLVPAVEYLGYERVLELLGSELSDKSLRRVFLLHPDHVDVMLKVSANPRAASSALDVIEMLNAYPYFGYMIRESWFANLFLHERHWISPLILALSGVAHAYSDEAVVALQALTHSLALRADQYGNALQDWAAPRLIKRPSELEALANALDISAERLVEYLHYRRVAGEPEEFSRALLEPLRQIEKERREVEFLQGRLNHEALEPEPREALVKRLEGLSDTQATTRRRERVVRRAHNRLQRAIEALRARGLQRALDTVARRALAQWLPAARQRLADPNKPLPAGLHAALHLLHATGIDHALLVEFLEDVLESRPLAARAQNRDWLRRAEAAGIDVARWQAGFTATLDVGGEAIDFTTEHDPLAVLEMGTYFDTCLGLVHGPHAASTLVNALDVNKQVIYGRRGDGTPVARKLIGATLDGKLIGYALYGGVNQADECALNREIARWAETCGLKLAHHAAPEVLHEGHWYDDGRKPWILTPADIDLPCNDVAHQLQAEARLVEAIRCDDRAALLELATSPVHTISGAAMSRLFLAEHDDPALFLTYANGTHFTLARLGKTAWIESTIRRVNADPEMEHWLLDYVLNTLPVDDAPLIACVDTLCRSLRRARSIRERSKLAFSLPPGHAALAGTRRMIDLAEAIARVQLLASPLQMPDPRVLAGWKAIIEVAFLLDGNARAVVSGLRRQHPIVAEIIIRLLEEHRVEGAERHLRKMLRQSTGERRSRLALALGTQESPRDATRLLALLAETPTDLRIAVAVTRCGASDAAEKARSLWQPPTNLLSLMQSPPMVGLLRELGPPQVVPAVEAALLPIVNAMNAAIARRNNDAAMQAEHSLKVLLNGIANLGLPTASPMDSVKRVKALADKGWHPSRVPDGLAVLWRKVQAIRDLRTEPDGARRALLELWQPPVHYYGVYLALDHELATAAFDIMRDKDCELLPGVAQRWYHETQQGALIFAACRRKIGQLLVRDLVNAENLFSNLRLHLLATSLAEHGPEGLGLRFGHLEDDEAASLMFSFEADPDRHRELAKAYLERVMEEPDVRLWELLAFIRLNLHPDIADPLIESVLSRLVPRPEARAELEHLFDYDYVSSLLVRDRLLAWAASARTSANP